MTTTVAPPSSPQNRPDPGSAWQAVLGRLQLEIPREQFDDFLRPCVGLRWDGDVLEVGATSTFAVSWLTLPLHREMVEEAVAKTVGATSRIVYRAVPGIVKVAAPVESETPLEPEDHCPNHPEDYLRWRTRWGSLRRMEQKYEDEIYYCVGDNGDCRWVYSRDRGVIIPAGPGKNTYDHVLAAYRVKRGG